MATAHSRPSRRASTAHPRQQRGGLTRLRRRLVWPISTRRLQQEEAAEFPDNDEISDSNDPFHQLVSEDDGISDSDDPFDQLVLLSLLAHAMQLDLHTLMARLEEGNGGGGGFGASPASAAAVAGLKKQTFHAAGEGCYGGVTECAICIEEFEDGEEVSVMPCSHGHKFHPECIEKWLGCSNVCPLCRHQLPTGVVHDHGA